MAQKSKIEYFRPPPKFMRHIMPWWVLKMVDRIFDLCWHKITLWKLDYADIENWAIDDECFMGSPDGWDYCGKHKPKGAKWFNKQWEKIHGRLA